MKKAFLFIIALSLLMGCSTADVSSTPEPEQQEVIEESESSETRKRPRIPTAIAEDKNEAEDDSDKLDELLEEIDRKINQPNITYEDIQRGWYYGTNEEKKYGTPETWVWIKDGKNSRWVSPNAVEETVIIKVETLCESTAGTYVVSCVETEIEDCEHIPTNTCRCIQGSTWHNTQGCILSSYNEETEKDEYVAIGEKELNQGWYQGLPYQKKLNTPSNWVWIDSGKNSRWQNPNPLN